MIEFLTEEKIVIEARRIIKEYLMYEMKGVRVKTVVEAIRNQFPRLYMNTPMVLGIIKTVVDEEEIEQFVGTHKFGVKSSSVKQLRYRRKE
jgi:hypothetical protein